MRFMTLRPQPPPHTLMSSLSGCGKRRGENGEWSERNARRCAMGATGVSHFAPFFDRETGSCLRATDARTAPARPPCVPGRPGRAMPLRPSGRRGDQRLASALENRSAAHFPCRERVAPPCPANPKRPRRPVHAARPDRSCQSGQHHKEGPARVQACATHEKPHHWTTAVSRSRAAVSRRARPRDMGQAACVALAPARVPGQEAAGYRAWRKRLGTRGGRRKGRSFCVCTGRGRARPPLSPLPPPLHSHIRPLPPRCPPNNKKKPRPLLRCMTDLDLQPNLGLGTGFGESTRGWREGGRGGGGALWTRNVGAPGFFFFRHLCGGAPPCRTLLCLRLPPQPRQNRLSTPWTMCAWLATARPGQMVGDGCPYRPACSGPNGLSPRLRCR